MTSVIALSEALWGPAQSSLNEPVSHDWGCGGNVGAKPDRLGVPVVRAVMGLAFLDILSYSTISHISSFVIDCRLVS